MRRALLMATLVAGCSVEASPRSQVVVHVDTDAPAPRMFDRLRLRVLDDRLRLACDACEREIVIDAGAQWPLSFGVTPRADGGVLHVAAVLYPYGRVATGGPQTATAIERVVRLPAGEGIQHLGLFLPVDCVGRPSDLSRATTCEDGEHPSVPITTATPATDDRSKVGTWHADLARPCIGAPAPTTGVHDEEACIPGGVFWMGDASIVGFGAGSDGVPEHPVALPSFFLDKYEWTVGRYRAALAAGYRGTKVFPRGTFKDLPLPWTGQDCNFTTVPTDAAQSELPLNCVPAFAADDLCKFIGRRLPTEAEWEWAAGNREAENLYPWGDHALPCSDLEDCGLDTTFVKTGWPVGSHPLDRTRDGVMDMSQNLSEWLADSFTRYDDDCWFAANGGVSPLCRRKDDAPWGRALRGDHYYTALPYEGMAPFRQNSPPNYIEWFVGFRCARDDAR